MKILPTMRDKKRYIAFEVVSEQPLKRWELQVEILNSAGSLFGDAGCSEMHLTLISYGGQYGIIRCAAGKTEETRAALACITDAAGGRASVIVLGISGTIKRAMEKFIQKRPIRESEPDNKEPKRRNVQFKGIDVN